MNSGLVGSVSEPSWGL